MGLTSNTNTSNTDKRNAHLIAGGFYLRKCWIKSPKPGISCLVLPNFSALLYERLYTVLFSQGKACMSTPQVFEQTITIQANATVVEHCITDLPLMHRWLNPALRCEPVGDWDINVGGQSRFVIQSPLWQPTLHSTVVERQPGLIVWQFTGFFAGQDRWECRPTPEGTCLLNRFEFEIPNPLVAIGFQWVAADWTKQDMTAQLKRLKQVAETLVNRC
jgi:hypothetical protein